MLHILKNSNAYTVVAPSVARNVRSAKWREAGWARATIRSADPLALRVCGSFPIRMGSMAPGQLEVVGVFQVKGRRV